MPLTGMSGKFHTVWGEFGGFKHTAFQLWCLNSLAIRPLYLSTEQNLSFQVNEPGLYFNLIGHQVKPQQFHHQVICPGDGLIMPMFGTGSWQG